MSKQGSEVAFIPDNISNISSGKEKFNEETSHKIEDSYISKLTKFQNPHVDPQNAIEFVDIKASSPQKYELGQDANPKQIVQVIAKKLSQQNMGVEYVSPNTERQVQKKFTLHKYIKQPNELPAALFQIKRYHNYHQSDNTYLYGKHTQTDVISEKESFVEEEHENSIDLNHKNSHQNVHFDNIVHYDSIQQSQKISKNKHSTPLKDKDYTDDFKQTFYVTEVNKYDEFDTEIGWLEHCLEGNLKYLNRQTNQLLDYNNAVMMEIQKVQLRTKIIELQIETNKLKIALRKSPSSKHINFSVDLKFKRPTMLRIPKRIDTDMRKYCCQLQKTVTDLKKMYQSNQKELSLLDFYNKEFEKKVNYAYIYQQYLVERENKQLMNNTINTVNLKLKSSPRNMVKNTNESLNFTLSPNRKQKVMLRGSSQNIIKRQKSKSMQRGMDQSVTSLAKKLKSKQKKLQSNKLNQNQIKTQHHHYNHEANLLIRNSKSTQIFIRHTDSQYYTELLDKTSQNHKKDQSITKRVSLTHHKNLSLPSNKKFVSLSTIQVNKSFLPLFNTPNRQKKHFYYECQMYLKQLQKDYLCQCQQQKRNTLLTNQNGFRQRELLKLKTHQIKNQILDTQVDIVSKQKQLNKQNLILKRELQILQNQLFTKYHDQSQLQNQNKMKKTIKSPVKLRKLLPDDYHLLYKQAQRRLQTYKSTNMLQNLRPNIPKSPKKISSQQSLQKITSLERISRQNYKLESDKNITQKADIKTVKKSRKDNDRKMSKSPVIVRLKSQSRSKKFLTRFKANLTQDFLNLTVKQNSPGNDEGKKVNPQTTVGTQRPNGINISIPQTEFIQDDYYAV